MAKYPFVSIEDPFDQAHVFGVCSYVFFAHGRHLESNLEDVFAVVHRCRILLTCRRWTWMVKS